MLTQTTVAPDGQPLTHLGCVQACNQLAIAGYRGVLPWVQVRKRVGGGPVVLCGQVIEIDAGSDNGEWFKVGTALGPLWIESRSVRLCSGDGRCTCEAEALLEQQGVEMKGVPHQAPLPGAGRADWRSGRPEA